MIKKKINFNSKKSKLFYVLLFGILLFSYGFLSAQYKIFPYKQIKILYGETLKKKILSNINSKKKIKTFNKCNIPIINSVPSNSIIFIGHAYGSNKEIDINYLFLPKILNFLELNSKNIDKVIFTGDIFQFPSILKWYKLNNSFGLDFEIHIAPGNHDILRPDSRDVFLQSKYGLKKYPYSIELMKNVLIIDDSISSKWDVSSETIIEILKNKNKLSIVARHNTPIKELTSYVNSSSGISANLMSYNDLKKIIPKTNKVVWVIGDSGAFEDLPRITCYKKDNHTFILNGIGDIKNDTIILLNQNNLFSYVLK